MSKDVSKDGKDGKDSKFAAVFARRPEPEETAFSEGRKSETPAAPAAPAAPAPTAEGAAPKQIGRPRGKKSDPHFRQVTVYLPAELHDRGREIAFQSRGARDFSQIVSDALRLYFQTSENSEG